MRGWGFVFMSQRLDTKVKLVDSARPGGIV